MTILDKNHGGKVIAKKRDFSNKNVSNMLAVERKMENGKWRREKGKRVTSSDQI